MFRKRRLFEDLSRYFGQLYGTRARLETLELPVYLLVRVSGNVNIQAAKKKGSSSDKSKVGKLNYLLDDYSRQVFPEPYLFVFDETCIEGTINLMLPDKESIHNLPEFRQALQKQGFDLIEGKRNLQCVVFTDRE